MQEEAKQIIVDYVNNIKNYKITQNDVYVVWFCKTLQNWKVLAATNIADGMYYEITYNGDKDETYVDVYKKWENFVN